MLEFHGVRIWECNIHVELSWHLTFMMANKLDMYGKVQLLVYWLCWSYPSHHEKFFEHYDEQNKFFSQRLSVTNNKKYNFFVACDKEIEKKKAKIKKKYILSNLNFTLLSNCFGVPQDPPKCMHLHIKIENFCFRYFRDRPSLNKVAFIYCDEITFWLKTLRDM